MKVDAASVRKLSAKSWTRCTNDGRWEKLDRRDTGDLDGRYITKTYECQRGITESFRHLRLRQTGKDSNERDARRPAEIELFVTLHRGTVTMNPTTPISLQIASLTRCPDYRLPRSSCLSDARRFAYS